MGELLAGWRQPGIERGPRLTFRFDGVGIEAYAGETVAAALTAAGRLGIRRSTRLGAPRGIYCNMGICYECLVVHLGRAVRGCMLPVEDGMELRSFGPEESGPEERTEG